MNAHDARAYFEQLTRYLTWQDERTAELERQLEQLRREVRELQEQRGVRIERIEYKFDQLKIEKLEGQLHIGLSPEGAQSIEQLVTGSGAAGQMTGQPAAVDADDAFDAMSADAMTPDTAIEGIRFAAAERVASYLGDGCLRDIADVSGRLGKTLDDDYVDLMVQDIRGQVDARVRHYARTGILPNSSASDGSAALGEQIAARVIRDIRTAIERHLSVKLSSDAEGDAHLEDDRGE